MTLQNVTKLGTNGNAAPSRLNFHKITIGNAKIGRVVLVHLDKRIRCRLV